MRHGVVRVEPIRLMAFGREPDSSPRGGQRRGKWILRAAAAGFAAGALALAGRWTLALGAMVLLLAFIALATYDRMVMRRRARISGRHLSVNEQGVAFEPARGPGEQLLAFGRPFGV